ncbi:hydrolase of the HAD superfamily [Halothermothrix orenii H 168]|uniref:Hydrolase of the HAD superfamily n=2 Tax=Halothermothrix orenii TaxID=31909 RepID=B8CXU2_HALOH|nr:hydrolase of the HAD superfamily [Halothermothrix orenii H 168]
MWMIEKIQRIVGGSRLTQVDPLKKVMDEHIVCFTIIDKKEKLEELSLVLEKKYGEMVEILLMENDYFPGWYWLTIHDVKATKDQAIKELVKITGHNLNDLIVFGDNANDIKMFREALKAVAVSNAKNELKKYADEIIGSNQDDSVVKYLINNSNTDTLYDM